MGTDFLVIGAGVAGLSAAIEAAAAGRVLVLTKDLLTESATEYSQGGVAVALSDDDRVSLHDQNTLQTGSGLCDPRAVRSLAEAGPDRIQRLIEWGAEFDTDGGKLTFSIEGAHRVNRVLHAGGDSTGREIARTQFRKAQSLDAISFRSFSSVVDLLTKDGEVCGAIPWNDHDRELVPVNARAVLLATGGIGRVYRETTNPNVATGDGVAMAYRAGAAIANMEMVQFHPTALFLEGAPRFPLSEALRDEGAVLRNADMQRFMSRYHENEELAPRDVVSRSVVSELARLRKGPVYLDLTHLADGYVRKRFARIYRTCLLYGVDLEVQPVPVHPAAHYAMGGGSGPGTTERPRCRGCSPAGKPRATACTARTAWRATRCSRDSCSAPTRERACATTRASPCGSRASVAGRPRAPCPATPSPTCAISPGGAPASCAPARAYAASWRSSISYRRSSRRASHATAATVSKPTTCTRSSV